MRLLLRGDLLAACLVAPLYASPASAEDMPHKSWEDRPRVAWEAGGAPSLSFTGNREGPTTTHVGATASLAVHRVFRSERSHEHEKGGWPEIEELRWCVQIACFGIGLLFAPSPSFIGNDLGLELRATGANGLGRVAARPTLRYAHGRFRTPTLIGTWLPEIALSHEAAIEKSSTYFVVAWSIAPAEIRVTDTLAIAFDPLRGGWMFDLAGGRGRAEIATEVALRWAP